jgi:hypothetical protein
MTGYRGSDAIPAERAGMEPPDRTSHHAAPLPPVDDRLCARLLTGEINPDIKTLATRLILTRLRIDIANDNSVLPRAVQELQRFFAGNKFAHRDLTAIMES